jgi:hypothetical protein
MGVFEDLAAAAVTAVTAALAAAAEAVVSRTSKTCNDCAATHTSLQVTVPAIVLAAEHLIMTGATKSL